jgi:hypothetical protein
MSGRRARTIRQYITRHGVPRGMPYARYYRRLKKRWVHTRRLP